jgi:phage gp29-like protein
MAKRSGAATQRAAKRDPKSYVDQFTSEVSLALQFGRIGGNLTPARVSTIMQQADSGRTSALVDLYHELREKDCHLQSIAQTREVCVASLPHDVAPRADKPLKKETKAARQCALALQKCDTFQTAISHWVGEGNAFGHATSELVWKVEKKGELAGLMVPDYFVNISCRRFGFRQSDGALLFDQFGLGEIDVGGVDLLAEFGPGKYMQYRPRVTGDVPVREGLSRASIWMALFRNFDLRDWLQLAEMAWKPKRTGKYKKDASKADKQALTNILERLTSTGVAIYPETVELMLHWPTNYAQNSPHKELAVFLAQELSKAWLGTSDVTEQTGKSGARAAVETRGELRKELRDWDALGISRLVTRNVVEPFYRFNYGDKIEAGTFVPMIDDPKNILEFGNGINYLRQAGLKIGQAWVRKQIGAPEPTPDEELLGDGVEDPKASESGNSGSEGDKKPKPKE